MRQKKFPLFLLIPLILLTTLVLSSVIICVIQSIGIIPSLGLTKPSLQYFSDLISGSSPSSSGNLLSSTVISLYIAFVSSFLSVLIGIFLCSIIVSCKKTNGFLPQLLTVPIMLPHLVVALFTVFLFSQSGIFPRLLYTIGILSSQEAFPALLYDQNSVGIIMAYLWKGIPFVCYFILPAMNGIEPVLYEAAYSMGAAK